MLVSVYTFKNKYNLVAVMDCGGAYSRLVCGQHDQMALRPSSKEFVNDVKYITQLQCTCEKKNENIHKNEKKWD